MGGVEKKTLTAYLKSKPFQHLGLVGYGITAGWAYSRVGASTSTQYLDTSTSTLKMFKYKYKYRVWRSVLGYYPSTLQMYLGTITKYQVKMYNITHKSIPINAKIRDQRSY